MPGDSVLLQVTPMFHVGGRGYVLGALWSGATVVIDRAFDARRMLETIERERVTFTFMVAAMLQAVLDVPNVRSYDLSSMRSIVSAAAPIPVPLLKRGIELLGPIFSIQYGSTEVGQICDLPRHEVNPNGTRGSDSSARVRPVIRCRTFSFDCSMTMARTVRQASRAKS